ncbi:MAG: methyltransferase domain-containing protein [Micavibrio sp.]|nr:methyltransferase domain-containing protein [Micavibrio sp.]
MSSAPNDIEVFDRTLLRQRRQRVAQNFTNHDFLFKWGREQLIERLSEIKRDFPKAIQLGARGGKISEHFILGDSSNTFSPDFITDEEFLALKEGSLDLVISNLSLHNVNDLPGTLTQIRRALKPDGLFLASIFGGETLFELRDALARSEIELKGGLSPRIFPFADKQQIGALLQRAGFALPVVDSDILRVSYPHMFKLMHDLRGMGESNIIAARDKAFVGRTLFMRAAQLYSENHNEGDGRITASFEVIFMLGWAPHESQQKPLKPGSADVHLSEVLKND